MNGEIKIILGDCMDLLRETPDKYFDLAIVDPPYGIGASNYSRGGTQHGKSAAMCKVYAKKDWDNDSPSQDYFDEIIRVSKNQIIWGANHFIHKMPYGSPCWIVWDKMTAPNSGYADCELAWTSFDLAVRQVKIQWSGMLQPDMKNKEERIHPTQKPVKLYEWVLRRYAKEGFKILDTHLGSGSHAIAIDNMNTQHGMNLSLTATEIDKDYYEASLKRLANHQKQLKLI